MAATAEPEPFWKRKTLDELSPSEWESLCDGCGLCCLQKLEDENDGAIYYTNIACKLLNLRSCRCTNYTKRRELVPDCVQITAQDVRDYHWLPTSCAYRMVDEGKDLPTWHHLVCGDRQAVHRAGISRSGRMLSETAVEEDHWDKYVIFRTG